MDIKLGSGDGGQKAEGRAENMLWSDNGYVGGVTVECPDEDEGEGVEKEKNDQGRFQFLGSRGSRMGVQDQQQLQIWRGTSSVSIGQKMTIMFNDAQIYR